MVALIQSSTQSPPMLNVWSLFRRFPHQQVLLYYLESWPIPGGKNR
jgi:hypothetical protein